MVIGFGNSTVSRLRTILEDLNLTLNMAKSGALVNSSCIVSRNSRSCIFPHQPGLEGGVVELSFNYRNNDVLYWEKKRKRTPRVRIIINTKPEQASSLTPPPAVLISWKASLS